MYRVTATPEVPQYRSVGLTHQLVTPGFDGRDVFVCACRGLREAQDLADTLNCWIERGAAADLVTA